MEYSNPMKMKFLPAITIPELKSSEALLRRYSPLSLNATPILHHFKLSKRTECKYLEETCLN